MDEIIELKGIYKKFMEGRENELVVLHDVDFSVKKGEFVAIVGASGSGKSTLMNIIGALDRPTEGSYRLHDVDVVSADDTKLSHIRNQQIGFRAYHQALLFRRRKHAVSVSDGSGIAESP